MVILRYRLYSADEDIDSKFPTNIVVYSSGRCSWSPRIQSHISDFALRSPSRCSVSGRCSWVPLGLFSRSTSHPPLSVHPLASSRGELDVAGDVVGDLALFSACSSRRAPSKFAGFHSTTSTARSSTVALLGGGDAGPQGQGPALLVEVRLVDVRRQQDQPDGQTRQDRHVQLQDQRRVGPSRSVSVMHAFAR